LVRSFRDLRVWSAAHQLTLAVYAASCRFPKDELYGLTSQLRRSAASIPANIAEGCGRSTVPDFVRFLNIAGGSASELEYHLLLAHDLRLLAADDYADLSHQTMDVKRMLTRLTQKLTADG
jgi:four helix bundle protein